METKAVKTALIQAPVTEQMRAKIDDVAKEMRRSRSEIIRFAIEDYLRQHAADDSEAA